MRPSPSARRVFAGVAMRRDGGYSSRVRLLGAPLRGGLIGAVIASQLGCGPGDATPDPHYVEPQLVGSPNQATCFMDSTGDVYCWGANNLGALGLGHDEPVGDDETPAEAGPLPLDVPAISVSVSRVSGNVCVLTRNGTPRCAAAEVLPAPVVSELRQANMRDIAQIVPRDYGACAVYRDGREAACWWGAESYLDDTQRVTVTVDQPPAGIYAWDADDQITCLVDPAGDFRCAEDLASRDMKLSESEFRSEAVPYTIAQLAGAPPRCEQSDGSEMPSCGVGCALDQDGVVHCWGAAWAGATGTAPTSPDCKPSFNEFNELEGGCRVDPSCCIGDDESPYSGPPVPLRERAVQLVGGPPFCALLTGGAVQCWGANAELLGYTDSAGVVGLDVPLEQAGVIDHPADLTQIAVGTGICALTRDGEVYCWGSGRLLGYGSAAECDDDETRCRLGDDEPVDAWGPISFGP